jgi:hypothetical protein
MTELGAFLSNVPLRWAIIEDRIQETEYRIQKKKN